MQQQHEPTPIKSITCDIKTSAQINELFDALAKAKAKFPVIEKNRTAEVVMKTGGKYSYSYADLADVNNAVTKPLSEEGLCVLQPMTVIEGDHFVVTVIAHKSGQWIQSAYRLDIDPDMTEQAKGSAITYARRYSLCAAMGIVAEDDDDGKGASDYKQNKKEALPRPQGGPQIDDKSRKPVTDGQIKRLFAIMNEHAAKGWGKEQVEEIAAASFKVKSFNELNMGQYDKLVDVVQKHTYQEAVEMLQKWMAEKAKKTAAPQAPAENPQEGEWSDQ